MPSLTIEYQTDAERIDLERAIAFVAEMRRTAATARFGTVLATCESHALNAGRQMLRETLESTLQSRVDAQKKRPATARKVDALAM
jgi:hypothetical protein